MASTNTQRENIIKLHVGLVKNRGGMNENYIAENIYIDPDTPDPILIVSPDGRGFEELNNLCTECRRGTLTRTTVDKSSIGLDGDGELAARVCKRKFRRSAMCAAIKDLENPIIIR